jgi:hypothetical protein
MTSIERIEAEIAELEAAAKQAAKSGMVNSGATLRNRAAGMRRALNILTEGTPLHSPDSPDSRCLPSFSSLTSIIP